MTLHPSMEVKCSVSNCKYNNNNYCFAERLEVNAMGDGYANTSNGTICNTFAPKDDKEKEDLYEKLNYQIELPDDMKPKLNNNEF